MGQHRRPEEIARQGANGVERNCLTCRAWMPQDSAHFYRSRHGNGWNPECKTCTKLRDQRRWVEKRGRAPCELAVVLGLTPRR